MISCSLCSNSRDLAARCWQIRTLSRPHGRPRVRSGNLCSWLDVSSIITKSPAFIPQLEHFQEGMFIFDFDLTQLLGDSKLIVKCVTYVCVLFFKCLYRDAKKKISLSYLILHVISVRFDQQPSEIGSSRVIRHEHIEAETKCPSFCRWHFQLHFRVWKL